MLFCLLPNIMTKSTLHIAMYPWFAYGHLTPFLHLANKFASKGHKISFFLPPKAQTKLQDFNSNPDLIKFFPVAVPPVEGLPEGAETTADVPDHLGDVLMTAMDRTRPDIEAALQDLKPDFVIYDFTYWLPTLAREMGIKSIQYCISTAAMVAYIIVRSSQKLEESSHVTEDELMHPPPDFPSSALKLHRFEAKALSFTTHRDYGENVPFHERIIYSFRNCDALGFRSFKEVEGEYCEYVGKHFGKPILLFGPIIPTPPTVTLEGKLAHWLNENKPGSVIFCAFGSECVIEKDQFQELVLGFELTGLPFLVALKPPTGTKTIEEALPEGFKERVEGRGIVEDGWVQQASIMAHPSIGCFVSHSGLSSVAEALVNNLKLLLIPQRGDQFIISRLMSGELKVGVEVERRDNDGWYSRESVCKAVESVMDAESEIRKEIGANRLRLRELLLQIELEDSCIDSSLETMRGLLNK